MKTIKERVSKKMNTAIADMRKESFKQGKWAEQKRVLGLTAMCCGQKPKTILWHT